MHHGCVRTPSRCARAIRHVCEGTIRKDVQNQGPYGIRSLSICVVFFKGYMEGTKEDDHVDLEPREAGWI